jgi:peroxiredoxin
MTLLRRLAAAAVLLVAGTAALAPARSDEAPGTARVDSVRDVRLPDLDGKEVGLADARDARAVVLVWTAPGCPVVEVLAPRVKALAEAYVPKGVRFLGVSSDSGTPVERLREHVVKHGWTFPVLRDESGRLAQRVGAKTSSTVVLLDRHRRVRYAGAVDDQYGVSGRKAAPARHWLRDALDQVLGAQAVAVQTTDAPGCTITFAVVDLKPTTVTWSAGAAEVIHRRCAGCHRHDEAAPFPLLSHADVAGRTAMIRQVIEEDRMPPWTAEGPPGTFANDRRLTPEEKTLLFDWLAGGAPEGDPKTAPPPPAPPGTDGWELGAPDAVLAFEKAQAVPAEGVVPYRFIEVPTDFPEDRWVTATEVRPGAPQVVHHILVQVVPKGARARKGAFDPLRGFFAAMVPGGRSLVYPAGSGKKLPQGSRLYFQVHYTPNGVATEDLTQIGLHFAKERPKEEVETVGVFTPALEIPPGAARHEVAAAVPILFDAKILSYMPHMHLRGTAFRYELVSMLKKDRPPELLLNVPRFDFNWQTPLRLAEPRFVKAEPGLLLRVVGTYDNSYANPFNPDPTATVRWGDQTWDEMLIGYLDFIRVPRAAAEPEKPK